MLTSDCPGSVEVKRMLQETADRVGAKFAMLVDSDGSLEACSGHHDRFTVESFASAAADPSRWQQEIGRELDQVHVYVDDHTTEEMARLYIRPVTGDRYLVTAFELDDGDIGTACFGGDQESPLLDEAARVRKNVR